MVNSILNRSIVSLFYKHWYSTCQCNTVDHTNIAIRHGRFDNHSLHRPQKDLEWRSFVRPVVSSYLSNYTSFSLSLDPSWMRSMVRGLNPSEYLCFRRWVFLQRCQWYEIIHRIEFLCFSSSDLSSTSSMVTNYLSNSICLFLLFPFIFYMVDGRWFLIHSTSFFSLFRFIVNLVRAQWLLIQFHSFFLCLHLSSMWSRMNDYLSKSISFFFRLWFSFNVMIGKRFFF